jgi:outer membrane protein, heavy metal efflux system
MRLLRVLAFCCAIAPTAAVGQAHDTLTVADAVFQALEYAPALAGQRARLQGERLAAPEAGRLPNPTLTWQGQGLRRNPPLPLQPDHSIFATQPIPLGPQRGAARRLAHTAIAVADADLALQREAITLDVVDLVVDTLGVGRLAGVLDDQRASLQELVRVQRRRVEEGVASEGDLRRLEAEEARLALAAGRSRAEERRVRAAVCVWTGRVSCDSLRIMWPDAADAPPADPALVDARLAVRPAVQTARAEAEQARRAADLAEASVWPSLEVSGGYARTQWLDTGMAGIGIAVPLFERQRAQRARASAARAAAELDLAQVERQARLELMQTAGLAADLQAQVRLQSAALMDPALAAQRAARSAYREGEVDLLRLLDAERLVADARTDVALLETDALRAALRARVLLGMPLP